MGSVPGKQLTANVGANLKELMARMGNESERTALIYQHSSSAPQRTLADAVGRMAASELAKPQPGKPSGTRTARKPDKAGDPADDDLSDLGK